MRGFTGAALAAILLLGPAVCPVEAAPAGRGGPSGPTRSANARAELRSLAATAPDWEYRELPAGTGPEAGSLPLVIWPAPKAGEAATLTVLLLAGQHGDEPSGSDALLQLARELAAGRHPQWRGRVRLLILPMMNPRGIDAGTRNNSDMIDLNRDHLRLKAAESRALHRLYAEWMPEVKIDFHQKPEPCRHIELARATHPSEDPGRRALARMVVEAAARTLADQGILSHPFNTRSYAVTSGAGARLMDPIYHPVTPNPSDALNSFALLGSAAFLIETAAGPPERPYSAIVADQRAAAEAMIGAVLDRAGGLKKAVARTRAKPYRLSVALQMRQIASPMDPETGFSPCGEAADRRAGMEPWWPTVEVTLRRARPAAYWLPARFALAAEVLAGHGVRLYRAVRDLEVEGEAGRITGMAAPPPEYQPRPLVQAAFAGRPVRVKAGDWVVPAESPYWDLVPVLLEADSQFGFGRYEDLGLAPQVGEDYPVVRLTVLPPADALVPWPPGPDGGRK